MTLVATLCLAGIGPHPIWGHAGSINLFVHPDSNQMYILETFEIPQMQNFLNIEISVDGPGFLIGFPSNGIATDAELYVDITQKLMYWDGNGLAATDETFRLSAPEFDNQGVFNNSPVETYVIDEHTGSQTGMFWGTYNGNQFWEAHGLNFLEPIDAPPGIYGVGARVRSNSHLATESFVIPFVYDPQNVWDPEAENVGVDRLRQSAAAYAIADLNADGRVDVGDADLLVAEIVSGNNNPGFDLSDDGLVNDKDLTDWRRKAGTALLPQSVPYLPGDANLDGAVDLADLHIVNNHITANDPAWSKGDFNADGAIDSLDFDIWVENRFTSSMDVFAATVPEPSASLYAQMLVLLGAICLRFRQVRINMN